MQSDLERIKEMVRGLPVEELDELEAAISEERKAKQSQNGSNENQDWRIERYKKARRWLDENGANYMNQWVCLEGDELISHGEDALAVHQKAIEQGIKSPFLHHIVEEPEFYMRGW